MGIEPFEGHVPKVAARAFVHSQATVLGEVEVHDEATVWPGAVLRGDQGTIVIGARSSVQDGSVAHATESRSRTLIGEECTVGHRVVLHGCVVGPRCLVGMGSLLLDNVQVGEWSFIGAGALLTPGKVFEPRSFILGSPARRVREVTAKEMEWITYSWKTYVDLGRRYLTPGPLS
jgi:carbonic anhydrase/acetyltransferase-like protein (isoleucine patch superfamily)